MSEFRLDLKLTTDGSHQLVLSLPHGPCLMDANDVEVLARTLAQRRDRMQPAVAMSNPTGPRTTIFDPRWYVAHESLIDGCALHLRHPGFGWLSFGMPLQSLLDLQKIIANVLDRVKHEQQSLRPN
jgi:hypothetical protein